MPAAETAVYFPRGDNIAGGLLYRGKSYFIATECLCFPEDLNPDCGCRQPGQSWAEALAPAEKLVSSRGKPDLVVDQQMAAQWARIQTEMTTGKSKKSKDKKVPAEEGPRRPHQPTQPKRISPHCATPRCQTSRQESRP